jgi:7,8-dihydropterin-6-yl-methyl-4-(beta-D-ribofuranosyl)aminobenzene 5'-phosphate synthase
VKAKVDLKNDFVVLSHRHSDHMASLNYVLSVSDCEDLRAPEGFGIYGSSLPSSLPKDGRWRRRCATTQALPQVMKFGAAWRGANFELIDKTTEIAPGITHIALVSDAPGTRGSRNSCRQHSEGMVLVVGCSHPGLRRLSGGGGYQS